MTQEQQPASARRERPSWWIFLPAAPVVLIMLNALIRDPRRLGDESGAADMPVLGFVVIAWVMSGLLVAIWSLSVFRYRTPVAVVQIAVVWLGGVLYLLGVRHVVTLWDVAEDGGLLLLTLVQCLPRRRRATSQGSASWDSSVPGSDAVPGRT